MVSPQSPLEADTQTPFDVVVYGGTAAGVTAAVQVAKEGKSVILIEPSQHIGGLTSGGLGATDIGNKAAIGGLSRRFYERIYAHYQNDKAWQWQKREDYRSRRAKAGDKAMWTFEPHVAEQVLRAMLDTHGVRFVLGKRLKPGLAKKDGASITSITMASGEVISGRMFIDATYEGDLMAAGRVRYTMGREGNTTHNETLNGVQAGNARHHQFIKPVDPYVKPGDPKSGLLPGIRRGPLPADGTMDRGLQAYCFRMCTTDVRENMAPWVKPLDYDEQLYELLFRNFEAGDMRKPWHPIWMPNRKTDTNNNFAVSTDWIGQNYDWPHADHEERQRIFDAHLSYQQGLMWSLAHHPRVPAKIRAYFQSFGPAKDEFTDHGHWPHQLYVREARRMKSDYVMTQHDCQGRRVVKDAVGLAAYTMDSHHVQRYVDEHGHVRNEGDVQVGGFPPYGISYRSIRPKREQCDNLLVPVCLSASHIAYGSIRMEPVFMVLGQSAASAACLAIDSKCAVQDIDIEALQKRLREDGQILRWTSKRDPLAGGISIAKLPGIVLDESDALLQGQWTKSTSTKGFVGTHYLHDDNTGKGGKQAIWRPKLKKAGRYRIGLAYTAHANRASNVRVLIASKGEQKFLKLNQRERPNAGTFHTLGTFPCDAGSRITIMISTDQTDGFVIVDAVQLLPVTK